MSESVIKWRSAYCLTCIMSEVYMSRQEAGMNWLAFM